jgi:AcrR family transcriptional regulator
VKEQFVPKMAPEAREGRRRELMEAGWRCVATKGYRNLTVDDVCNEAGLSKGSFYTYFGEKRDLLVALLEEEAAGVDALIESLAQAGNAGPERIERLLEALMRGGEDAARAQLRADLWAEVATDEALRERLATVLRQRRKVLADWVTAAVEQGELVDIPANAFAAILLALADGLMVHAALDPGGFRWVNVGRAVRVVLEALEAERQ